jgi:hypothetical protein
MAASDIFIPGRVLVTPRDIMSENIVGDETADKTDMPLLIESTREGTIYGLAPSITTYATNSLFRKNYLSAMRKRNKERNDTSDPTARHSEFHTTLKFLKDEMAKRHGTGGPTNVPDLHKVPLPIEKKAIALAPVIATACSDSGPLILHRGTKRYGRLLGAEYQSERLSLIYNTANDHERRCDLAKESFLPMAAYWRIPENNDGSIIIVGRQDTNKVQYVIAPTKGSISKYRAARERLLQDVSSICMDTSD